MKHTHHHEGSKKKEESKVNIPLLSVVAIIAIIIMVSLAVSFKSKISKYDAEMSMQYASQESMDSAASIVEDNIDQQAYCRIIAGATTIYDDKTLSILLRNGESAYYYGYSIRIAGINDDGCVVDVNGNIEYLAVGQVKRVGSVYITIKDASK